MTEAEREAVWARLMAAAIDGDGDAYHRLLQSLGPALRGVARRGLARYGAGDGDVEDVVQETLLAIHLKRATWDRGKPIGPWVTAIARHKLIDALRRRGRRAEIPIDDVAEGLAFEAPAADQPGGAIERRDVDRMLERLGGRQRDIVRAVSVEGRSIRETAERLDMSEGAVRVALHRGLRALALIYRRMTA